MKYKLDLGSPKNKEAKHIIFITAKATGTNVQMLVSRCRVRNLVDARRICYVMLRDKLKMTYGEIGSHFDRDHAWPGVSYIIVSVQKGKSMSYKSWQLHEKREFFIEENINKIKRIQ